MIMASVYSELAALGISYSDAMKDANAVNTSSGNKLHPGNAISHLAPMDCVCKLNDFIILSEFSEVKGPIPLLTVPEGITEMGVDLDDFILKIMSMDYQACASGTFRFMSDTQVLQTDVIDGIHAYTHYFTLNDIYARGFVRPMCLAYISRNKKKLELKMSELREKFLKVSDTMKNENRCLFLEEVSLGLQRLKDVEHRYFLWKQRLEDEELENYINPEDAFIPSLDQLMEQQMEFNKILQSARSVLENAHLCEALSPWKDAFSVSRMDEIEQYMAFIKVMVGYHEPLISNQRRCDSVPELRPIAALSPFGVAIGIWYLCQILWQFGGCDLQLWGGCFWVLDQGANPGNKSGSTPRGEAQEAISCAKYRKLLLKVLPTCLTIPYGVNIIPKLIASESESHKKVTSGNEASSSYYSAPESNNEHVNSLGVIKYEEASAKPQNIAAPDLTLVPGSTPLQSLRFTKNRGHESSDDDSSSDGFIYEDAPVSECETFPASELWSSCVWTGKADNQSESAGDHILHFFQTFSKVAQHILFSLLTGRTVVIAGSHSLHPKVEKIISALVYFVPVEEGATYLRWHRGILISAHIENYKVIGLCVPERLTIHDMISPRDKNLVTILDVNAKKILGPAYSGVLLDDFSENFDQNFLSTEALILFIQSVFAGIHQKVLLYKALSVSEPKVKLPLVKDIALALRISGRDIDILNHLRKFIPA